MQRTHRTRVRAHIHTRTLSLAATSVRRSHVPVDTRTLSTNHILLQTNRLASMRHLLLQMWLQSYSKFHLAPLSYFNSCLCGYIHMYMHIRSSVRLSISASILSLILSIQICIFIYVCAQYLHIYIYLYMYIHTYITYMHIYIYTNMY